MICLFRSDWLKVARNLPEWLVQSHLDSDWLMVVAYVLLIAVTEKKKTVNMNTRSVAV